MDNGDVQEHADSRGYDDGVRYARGLAADDYITDYVGGVSAANPPREIPNPVPLHVPVPPEYDQERENPYLNGDFDLNGDAFKSTITRKVLRMDLNRKQSLDSKLMAKDTAPVGRTGVMKFKLKQLLLKRIMKR